MLYKQNLHTHTVYADGKNTAEELILEAIKKGFTSIGFSEHSYMSFSDYPYQMTVEDAENYKREVRALKEKYKNQIDVFCGLEYEYFSEVPLDGYDYLIGSVHYLEIDGKKVGFDRSLDAVLLFLNTHFNGDGLAFAKSYFERVKTLPTRGKFDILGHFDVLTKTNEKGKFLDETDERYLAYGIDAIRSLKSKIPLFEVNTGAIGRGYKSTPYPNLEFMKEFKKQGYGAVITSDCHNKDFLDCGYDLAKEMLLEAGFKSKFILTNSGFKEVDL